MAGRASVWSDERVIAAARDFVPAADETWRLQRGDDAECRHFQSMANQGHYGGGMEGPGGDDGTRQGIYACAPSGALLASVNSLDAEAVLAMLRRAAAAWEELPDVLRWLPQDARLAAATIAPEHRWEWSYPADGLVLERTVRDLPIPLDPHATPIRPGNRDFVWFSAAETRSLLPDEPVAGASRAVPALLVQRLARFHLVDNVRGQTLPFAARHVAPDSALRAMVLAREGPLVTLELRGRTRAEDDGRPDPAAKGDWAAPEPFPRAASAELLGFATYDLASERFTDFAMVALGERRGSGWLNDRGADEAGPIGWAFSLARDTPAARVPPAFIDAYDAPWVRRP